MRNSDTRGIFSRRAWIAAALAAFTSACGRSPLRGQYYFVEDDAALQSLNAHAARIAHLSPAWYSFDEHGLLNPAVNLDVLRLATSRRMKITPLVVNRDFNPRIARLILNDPKLKRQAIADLAAAAKRYGFHGYELDFENIAARDRDRYSAFAADLAHALGSDKTLSIAVPAPVLPAFGDKFERAEAAKAYDYSELSKVVDCLSLMAYDEHTGYAGPVASHPWVEACLIHTLAAVPPNKIRLGIPFYYRSWNSNSVREGSYAEAAALAATHSARIALDEEQKEMTFRFRSPQGEEVVWLHDAASLGALLDMAASFRLAGFSAWRLGQEDPRFWSTTIRRVSQG
jgi:spore germination protein YaaH